MTTILLLKEQREMACDISRLLSTVKKWGLPRRTNGATEAKCRELQEYWCTFQKHHKKLLKLLDEEEEQYHQYVSLYNEVERTYKEAQGTLDSYLDTSHGDSLPDEHPVEKELLGEPFNKDHIHLPISTGDSRRDFESLFPSQNPCTAVNTSPCTATSTSTTSTQAIIGQIPYGGTSQSPLYNGHGGTMHIPHAHGGLQAPPLSQQNFHAGGQFNPMLFNQQV